MGPSATSIVTCESSTNTRKVDFQRHKLIFPNLCNSHIISMWHLQLRSCHMVQTAKWQMLGNMCNNHKFLIECHTFSPKNIFVLFEIASINFSSRNSGVNLTLLASASFKTLFCIIASTRSRWEINGQNQITEVIAMIAFGSQHQIVQTS